MNLRIPVYKYIALALFAGLIVFQLHKAAVTPIWRDDAYFASVAKNLALGNGYASVFFDELHPFDGHAYSPVIIFSAAMMIRLLGNQYWVPGITNIFIIDGLLVFVFWQLRRVVGAQAFWQCCTVFLVLSLCITNHEYGFPEHKMLVWHAFLGDIPSALLVIAAVLYIAADRNNPKRVLFGGLIAGMGCMCKLLALIGCGVIGLSLASGCLLGLCRHILRLRQAASLLLHYAAGLFLPLALFELYKLISLGFVKYYSMTKYLFFLIHSEQVGQSSIDIIFKTLKLQCYIGFFTSGGHTFDIAYISFIVLFGIVVCTYLILAALQIRAQIKNSLPMPASGWAFHTLACAAIAHLAWWIFICPVPMERYVTQGLMYAAAAVALVSSGLIEKNRFRGNVLALMVMAIMLFARWDAVEYIWQDVPTDMDGLGEQLVAEQKLSAYLADNPGTIVFSCGNAFEMEYLLPQAANFTFCGKIRSPLAQRNHILLTFLVDDTRNVLNMPFGSPFAYYVNIPKVIMDSCPRNDIFFSSHYFISSCK